MKDKEGSPRARRALAMMFVTAVLMAAAGCAFAGRALGQPGTGLPSVHLTGLYRLVGDGELCFLPSADSVGQLPEWEGGRRLCFVNNDALDVLHASDAFRKVGESRICGFEGRASVVVENLRWVEQQGEGRYEGTLVDATGLESPSLILCGSPQDACYTVRDAEATKAFVQIEWPSEDEDYRWTSVPGIDLDADGLGDRVALGRSASNSHSPGDLQALSYTVSSTAKTFAVAFPVIGLMQQDASYYVRGVTYSAPDTGPHPFKRVELLRLSRSGLVPVCSYEVPWTGYW